MEQFEINKIEKLFFEKQLEIILVHISELNGIDFLEVKEKIHSFMQKLKKDRIFNSDEYLGIVKEYCSIFKLQSESDKLKHILLEFSCICCDVRNVYLEFKYEKIIGEYLDRNNFISNDYNQLLLQDIITNYYYEMAIEILTDKNVNDLQDFFKNKISNKLFTYNSLQSILISLKKSSKISQMECENINSYVYNYLS